MGMKSTEIDKVICHPDQRDASEYLIRKIVEWATENSWQESGFLSPDPQHNVNTTALCDFIADDLGYGREAVAAWVDEIADKMEQRERPI